MENLSADVFGSCSAIIWDDDAKATQRKGTFMGYIEEISNKAYSNTSADFDVSDLADDVYSLMQELLTGCSIAPMPDSTRYTSVLVDLWITFSPVLPGGSRADYCSEAARKAINGFTLHLSDQDIADKLVDNIYSEHTIDPRRWFNLLVDNAIIDTDGTLISG